jgi:hypothetical protein
MERNGNLILVFSLCLLTLVIGNPSQAQEVWTQVTMDRTSAYVGQPVEVKISAYTSTWFTSGIDLGNIKVNGAFTVYFRPVSRSIQQDGKTYAGVELLYHVFPYTDEDITFPSLEIEVETPPEGEYKGVKQTLKTQERKITVKPIPPTFSEEQWLVATGLRVNDNWSGNRQTVKVGDVLERRIARTAFGTVAELIPPIAWDSLPGVSQYPSRSAVDNQKSKTAISASRTETMRYLFEEEGEVTLPEMVFSWYHPYQQKLYKRTLPEVTFTVEPNPDLGVLASVRDSLQQAVALEAELEAEQAPFTILGMSPKIFLAVAALSILIVLLLIVIFRKTTRLIQQRRARYRNSEAYYFHLFAQSVRKHQHDSMLHLYRWIDELELAEPSAYYFAKKYGTPALVEEAIRLENQSGQGKPWTETNLAEWKKARQNYKQRDTKKSLTWNTAWINPGDGSVAPAG